MFDNDACLQQNASQKTIIQFLDRQITVVFVIWETTSLLEQYLNVSSYLKTYYVIVIKCVSSMNQKYVLTKKTEKNWDENLDFSDSTSSLLISNPTRLNLADRVHENFNSLILAMTLTP